VSNPSGSLPDGSAGPHAVVDDVDAPALSDHDRHHLERSLRLRDGDPFTVTDGRGAWRPCLLRAGGVEPAGARIDVPRPHPRLTVAFALAKGSKPELAIQKLTELGIDRIVVFESERSVARLAEERSARVVARFERIMREALMQSRGVWLPTLEIGGDFTSVAALEGALRADRGGRPVAAGDTTVLIGPEGGWSDGERRLLPTAVSLAPTVLRAETAAIAAGVLLAAHRSSAAV
jgi:16S rRNA (uracil1498-N3)-methyltransferase